MGYEYGHLIVSLDGWSCDICGVEVNGQTDESGHPLIDGDSVRHTGDMSFLAKVWREGYEAGVAAADEFGAILDGPENPYERVAS